eukprot:Pgem_evm1s17216
MALNECKPQPPSQNNKKSQDLGNAYSLSNDDFLDATQQKQNQPKPTKNIFPSKQKTIIKRENDEYQISCHKKTKLQYQNRTLVVSKNGNYFRLDGKTHANNDTVIKKQLKLTDIRLITKYKWNEESIRIKNSELINMNKEYILKFTSQRERNLVIDLIQKWRIELISIEEKKEQERIANELEEAHKLAACQ